MNSPGCAQDALNTNTVYGKLAAIKITNVLYSNTYCCICLETCDGLLGFDTCGVVDGGEKNLMIMTLKEMLEAIFDETVLQILRDSSDHLCPACTESIKKTLSFIQQTKTHALIFAKYFTTLNRLTTNLLQLSDTESISTVVLNVSLDNIPKDAQREGVKRKNEDVGPQVRKIAKVGNNQRDKLVQTTGDIEREDNDNGGEVGVIAESNESRNDKASPGNDDKGSQQLSSTSKPMHVTKECCPVCEKRPCIHEKYLAAFEKRRRNGIIECPECKELLYTLNDLIKHVNMNHFNRKPTIRAVCNKIFRRDLVNTDEVTKIPHPSESHEFENRNQYLHEVDETEKDTEVMEQDGEITPTHIEQIDGPCREKVSLSHLSNKGYKILRLERQESEECLLHPAASPTKDTCSTGTVLQKETDKNINGRDTEQIIDKTESDLSNKQHREQSAIEQKIGVRIDSEPMQCDIRNNLVQNDLLQNDETLCPIPDASSTSEVQKTVLTSILKKNNAARKKHNKSVKFGDCPTLSDWRKAAISENTELQIEAKMKPTKKANENEKSSSTNIEQDISKIQEGIEILNSKSLVPLVQKSHVNKTAQRELSIVLIDVLKNRKLANPQPQTSVFDDRYKILLTNIKNDKIRRLGSKQQPVNSTPNPDVNETTVVNKSDIHEGKVMNVGKALQVISPKTNQGTSLTCREKPISGIFESTEVSHKIVITQNKRVLPEVSVCLTDVLQRDSDLNQNPLIPNDIQTDLSKRKIINPVPQKPVKCTQYKKPNVSPNKKDSINTKKVHENTNIELKPNDIQNKVFAADISKEKNSSLKAQESIKSIVTPKVDVSPKNKYIISQKQKIVHEQSNNALKTVQFICNDIKKKGVVNILSDEIIVYPKPQESIKSTVISPSNDSPNQQDSINVPKVVHLETNIAPKTSQEIVEKSEGKVTCKENTEKNTETNNEKLLNLERKSPPSKEDSTNRQRVVREQTNIDLKTAQTKGESTCIASRLKHIVRPNVEKMLNVEGKSSPNIKHSRNTHSVVQEQRSIELKTVILVNDKESPICKENIEKNIVSPNDGNVFNLEIKSAPSKRDTIDTQKEVHEETKIQLKTAKEVVEKCIGQSTSKEKGEKKSERPNEAKVSNLGRTHARIVDRKKFRREVVKKTILGNLRKKNGTMYRLPQKPVLRNLTKKGLMSLSDSVKKNIVEESDQSHIEKEEPVSVVEIIEEAKIMEKNKKQLLTYEKKRRNRTFECPECKKMLSSLKDLIAHVNKNNCQKKATEFNSKESQSISLKNDNIKRLKSVVNLPKLGNKSASVVHTAPKRIGTSIETDDAQETVILENYSSIIHEPATSTAQKKSSQKENEVKCSQCNVLACKHERYRQAYDKLRKNKIIKCPDCKYIIYFLSDFIEHVNKNHTGNKIILRDIYHEEFPNIFVRAHDKSEKLKNDCAPAKKTVSADIEVGMKAKRSEDDATSETKTPMEFEVEFLEDMEELEEMDGDETDREVDSVTNKDKTTDYKSNEPVKCHKCQLVCPNKEAYKQHLQEHDLLVEIYKEVTAEPDLEDMMKNETENVEIEGNKRNYKCGTCGAVCKSRMQLTLHLKSTGHVLQGTISCPQCVKRPCRHERYLCAYEKQKATGKIECYECKNTHSSLSDLIAHVNNEHSNVKFIKCDVCDKMVRSNLFKKHDSNCHKQQAPVKCAKCPALFVNEEAYMVHNLEHELLELKQVSTETELTKKSKAALKELERSEIIGEENTYECGTCGKMFRHRSWLKLHLKTTDHVVKRELSCPQCSKRPCKHEDYLLAFENHNEKNKLQCQQCKDSINSLNNFIEHVNKDHLKNKPIKCDCCKEEFYLKSQLMSHLKVHEPKLTCEHCYCEFRRSLFRKHKMKCQYVKKRVKCAQCPALFPNEKAYTIHKQEHPEIVDNVAATSVKKSSFNTEVEGNSKEKSNRAKYDCPICRFHCSRREKLTTHLNSAHKMESRRTCSVCVKVFPTTRQHLDHREAKENKFNKCNVYKKKNFNMRPNPREKRSCNVCKRMVARGAFAVHSRMHAREPYPCHACDKRFKRSSDRALHVRLVHIGK